MRLYGQWSVRLPGEEYVWSPDDTTLGENLMIETETGGTFDEWVKAIDERRAVACQVLVWFLRRQAGRQEDRMAVDFPIRRLDVEKLGDADPEASAGSEPATPPDSPPSTESDPGNGTDSPEPTSPA